MATFVNILHKLPFLPRDIEQLEALVLEMNIRTCVMRLIAE